MVKAHRVVVSEVVVHNFIPLLFSRARECLTTSGITACLKTPLIPAPSSLPGSGILAKVAKVCKSGHSCSWSFLLFCAKSDKSDKSGDSGHARFGTSSERVKT